MSSPFRLLTRNTLVQKSFFNTFYKLRLENLFPREEERVVKLQHNRVTHSRHPITLIVHCFLNHASRNFAQVPSFRSYKFALSFPKPNGEMHPVQC